jgi:hypothetical protein
MARIVVGTMAKKKFGWVAGEVEDPDVYVHPGRGRGKAKRRHQEIEALAIELLDATADWKALGLSDEMIAGLKEGRRLRTKGGRSAIALRRHMRFLAGVLSREESPAIIARFPE